MPDDTTVPSEGTPPPVQDAASPQDPSPPTEHEQVVGDRPSGDEGTTDDGHDLDPAQLRQERDQLAERLSKAEETANRATRGQSSLQRQVQDLSRQLSTAQEQWLRSKPDPEKERLKDLAKNDPMEFANEWLKSTETDETVEPARREAYTRGWDEAKPAARIDLANEVFSHPLFDAFTVDEKKSMYNEVLEKGEFEISREADTLALLASKLASKNADELASLKAENESLKNELSEYRVDGAGAPARRDPNRPGTRNREEILTDPTTPIETIREIREKERAGLA